MARTFSAPRRERAASRGRAGAVAAPASVPVPAPAARARLAVRRGPPAPLPVILGVGAAAGVAAYLAVRHWRAGHEGQTLPVVADMALDRFCGTWYEQARLPNRRQRYGAGQVSVHYSLRPDGKLDVLNRWVGRDGHVEQSLGVARSVAVAGVSRPGRLAVRMASAWLAWLPPVWDEYWVIQLDEDEQYALVGSPDRKNLWVLSRRPRLQALRLRELLGHAAVLGFPVRRVIRTAV